jgi:mevalonate kinase
LTFAAQLTLKALGVSPPDLTVEVRSTIPIGSGFGSGAAVTAALIRALSAALGTLLEGERLNALVFEVEKMHHGTPSGIDNTVIVTNRPVYFVRDQPLELFKVGREMHLLVANSGISALTREAVGDVRKLVERDPDTYGNYIQQIGAVVRQARLAIEAGDWETTGQQMTQNHDLLRRLTVSSDLLDKLVQTAQEAGALGAKLSGGGRGGNLIALVEPGAAEKVSAALRKAGAVKVWPVRLDRQAN